jgi:phosphoribosyl 1,2-cyclic phosphate phosphodiesterase
VVFLGTGTSHGVPMIGCDCAVCRSTDPRDKRTRTSIVVETDGGAAILIDTSTDLRLQALREDVRMVDAILFTHAHADHISGLDDVRRFNAMSRRPMPVYGAAQTLAEIRRRFDYIFSSRKPVGGGIPELQLWTVAGPFCIGGQEIVPVPIMHGPREILGYRFGRFAYLTDCSGIPDRSLALLGGLDVLVLDALRPKPHVTHFSVDQALAMAGVIGARQTYFTHMAHEVGHAATCAALPPGVALAYDGLRVSIDAGTQS